MKIVAIVKVFLRNVYIHTLLLSATEKFQRDPCIKYFET